MKINLMQQHIAHNLLDAAVNVHMRGENRPVSFTVAVDDDSERKDGTVDALAHVLVLSVAQALEIESELRKRGLINMEVIRSDFHD